MSLNVELLGERLCKALCGEVTLRKTPQGFLQIITPFTFSDGDVFQLYIEEGSAGSLRLNDYGHTFMQLSYDNDLDKFREGTRRKLFDQLLAESGVREEEGKLVLDTTIEDLGRSVLKYGQAITRIYDLTFLNRARVASTFYEDLKELLYKIVDNSKITPNFILPDQPNAQDYSIDYRIEGKRGHLFLVGIASRDKARLATIVLEHWLRYNIEFDSLLVFQDQQEIPRSDLARLSNAGGEMVASLDATDDFRRKLTKLAA
jgi:hypothetical protein